MNRPRPGEEQLIALLAHEARGPRRHALFAAWLTARVCLDMAGPIPVSERNERRRLQALRTRLGTLSLPVAFRRSLHDIMEELSTGSPEAPVSALDALARAVRDTLGDRPAAAISKAVKQLRRPGRDVISGDDDRTEAR